MSSYKTTEYGIIVPSQMKQKAYKCGSCPEVIYPQNEPNGQVVVKKGKPVCVKCRMKGDRSYGAVMRDEKKFRRDLEDRQLSKEERENRRVAEIAARTQRDTGTQIKS